MPRHDFGIMRTALKEGERYESYVPQEYNCVSVEDDYMQPLAEGLKAADVIGTRLPRPNLVWRISG